MNNQKFSLKDWLPVHHSISSKEMPTTSQEEASILASFSRGTPESHKFKLKNYILEHWDGKSLASKPYFHCKKHLQQLVNDIEHQLVATSFTQKQQASIYNEYNCYTTEQHIPDALSQEAFWYEIHFDYLKAPVHVLKFAKIYCAQIAILYFLQLKLITTIYQKNSLKLTSKDLGSLPQLLNKLFPIGTSKELKSILISSNQFSWYRPSEHYLENVWQLHQNMPEISPQIIHKLYSSLKDEKNIRNKHALSHVNFGLFLNQLLLNFPIWFQQISIEHNVAHQRHALTTTQCLYEGDYCDELAKAYFLAQENNATFKWDTLICPDFIRAKHATLTFDQLYNEYLSMIMLTKIHHHYDQKVTEFIAHIANAKQQKSIYNQGPQTSLFNHFDLSTSKKFDAQILNITELPKNNPHYYLIQKITGSLTSLVDEGNLIVLSTQNLFLPSQKDKVETLLKKITLCAIISLELLEGKGESPSFIYLFTKNAEEKSPVETSCLNFKFSGTLNSFQDFNLVSELLNLFFDKYFKSLPALFHCSHKSIKLDFFTDSILNGSLVHSGELTGNKITHPSFLKNVTKNCLPLDFFFEVISLDQQSLTQEIKIETQQRQTTLSIPQNVNTSQSNMHLSLILDLRDTAKPSLELISQDHLKSYVYEYGVSECFYYTLRSKFKDLNVTVLKEYFASNIGKQIIQLSFTGNQWQLKSKISSLLLPSQLLSKQEETPLPPPVKFFLDEAERHVQQLNIDYLKESWEMLKNFEASSSRMDLLIPSYCFFKNLLVQQISRLHFEKEHLKEFNFNTAQSRSILTKQKLQKIFPSNKEVRIDFVVDDVSRLQSDFTAHHLTTEALQGKIDIYHKEDIYLSIRTSIHLAIFINFLLRHMPPMSMEKLLSSLMIPSAEVVSQLIQYKWDESEFLSNLLTQVDSSLDSIFTQAISQ